MTKSREAPKTGRSDHAVQIHLPGFANLLFTSHLRPDIKTAETVNGVSERPNVSHEHVKGREERYTFRSPGISLHTEIPFLQLYGVVIAQ